MSIWRALGDLSFVVTALLALANLAEMYPPLARCFVLVGGECNFPYPGLLFVWGFFSQVGTIPLGVPMGACACIEAIRRLRGASQFEMTGQPMRAGGVGKVMWGVGWWLYVAGWFVIIITPVRVALALWQVAERPGAPELVPAVLVRTAVLMAIGVGAVMLGAHLRRRNPN